MDTLAQYDSLDANVALATFSGQAAARAIDGHSLLRQRGREQQDWALATARACANTQRLHFDWLKQQAQVFCVSPDLSDYIIIPVATVVSSLPNINGDAIAAADMLEYNPMFMMPAYRTLVGKGTYHEHKDNLVPQKASGLILDAYVRRLPRFRDRLLLIELLAWDRQKNPLLARAILNRELNSYSVGWFYSKYTCSMSGQQAKPSGKTAYTDSKRPTYVLNGKLVYRYLHQIRGAETSAVDDPAFSVAFSDEVTDLSKL